MPRHPTSSPLKKPRLPRAFTLIEVMVVVAIIAILAGILVSVGLSVKTHAAINSTKTTLKTLDALMQDYLKDGNKEPQPPTAATWAALYGNAPIPPFAQTKDLGPPVIEPSSDPINWVIALRANPQYSKKIETLVQGSDFVNGMPTRNAPLTINVTILDAFGTPIRYVPYNSTTKKEGYFISAGPDRIFSNEDPAAVSPPPTQNPPGTNQLPFDDISSTDP